jgi:hypothetical protein
MLPSLRRILLQLVAQKHKFEGGKPECESGADSRVLLAQQSANPLCGGQEEFMMRESTVQLRDSGSDGANEDAKK